MRMQLKRIIELHFSASACHMLYTLLYCCLPAFAACLGVAGCFNARLLASVSLSAQRDDAAAGSKTYASQTPIAADYEPLDLRTPSQPPGIAYHYCYWSTTHRRMPSRLASPHQTTLGPSGNSSRVHLARHRPRRCRGGGVECERER